MTANPQQRPPITIMPTAPGATTPAAAPDDGADLRKRKLSTMEKLEKQSQPYIVIVMAITAAIRTMYIFTDKLINLAHLGILNDFISAVTGLALAFVSELTISIAGRRAKAYRALLYQAKQAHAVAKKRDRELWDVEIKRFNDQVNANTWMMRGAVGMSLYAGASYLIDSIGATGAHKADLISLGISILSACSIVGYILWLVVYHGVQTDEIPEDGSSETASRIQDQLNLMRIEEMSRLRDDLQSRSLDVGARLALIASGLPITGQKLVMPTIKLLVGQHDDEGAPDDDTAGWWNMRQLALACGENFNAGRKIDDITRKYRRRTSENAEKYRDSIRLDSERGWIVEPTFARDFWNISDENFERMFADASSQENEAAPGV